MMRQRLLLLALALLGGCGSEPDSAQQAREDAIDIARVEAAQNATPPIVVIAPEPIGFRDLQDAGLEGRSCSFRADNSRGFVVVALAERAVVKVDGNLLTFAADSGSAPMLLGIWSHYEGKAYQLDLQAAGDEAPATSAKVVRSPGRLTIRDAYDRVVYTRRGTLVCGVTSPDLEAL